MTRLGEQQPVAGQNTFRPGEQTVWEKNEGLVLASRERKKGCLTNDTGNKETFGAEKSLENWGVRADKFVSELVV